MNYPAFPIGYPVDGLAPPMGLIPVELDIEGLYEDHDRRRRKNGNEKTVSSHVHSVYCLIRVTKYHEADLFSAAELKIVPRNEHFEIGKRNT